MTSIKEAHSFTEMDVECEAKEYLWEETRFRSLMRDGVGNVVYDKLSKGRKVDWRRFNKAIADWSEEVLKKRFNYGLVNGFKITVTDYNNSVILTKEDTKELLDLGSFQNEFRKKLLFDIQEEDGVNKREWKNTIRSLTKRKVAKAVNRAISSIPTAITE